MVEKLGLLNFMTNQSMEFMEFVIAGKAREKQVSLSAIREKFYKQRMEEKPGLKSQAG